MANKLGDRSTRPHRAPHNKFSGGQYARAISDRSGLEFPYQEMVFEWNGSFVHNSEFEPKQPQLDLTYLLMLSLYKMLDHKLIYQLLAVYQIK